MNAVILLLIADEYLEIIAVLWDCLLTLLRETETELNDSSKHRIHAKHLGSHYYQSFAFNRILLIYQGISVSYLRVSL